MGVLKKIAVGFLLIVLVLVGFYVLLYDIDLETLDALMINLISSFLLLFLTLFVLDRIVNSHLEKVQRDKIKRDYINLLKIPHETLLVKLEQQFIVLVTSNSESMDVKKILADMDRYVDESFLKRQYTIRSVNSEDIFNFKETHLTYQQFNSKIFKKTIFEGIGEYIHRYAAVLPVDVIHSLIKFEAIVKSNIFVVPEDHGVTIDISNAKMNPEDFKVQLRKLGNELIVLRETIESN